MKKIKNTFINHVMKNGNKKTCELILRKSFKMVQKSCKKSHKTILKLAVINSTTAFRIIKLKKKLRKKKNKSKEIPKFVLNSYKRISWAIKFITHTTKQKSKTFYHNLKQEIISNCKNEEKNTIKIDLHKQSITQKRLFFYFRW
jgi:ribosomal protein S7